MNTDHGSDPAGGPAPTGPDARQRPGKTGPLMMLGLAVVAGGLGLGVYSGFGLGARRMPH